MSKLDIANDVLKTFAKETRIEVVGSHITVAWDTYGSPAARLARRWMTRGNDFYPVWHSKWPHGGTACTALSQLVRWLQDRPVLSIASWRYWASERCLLLPNGAVDRLQEAGYPEQSICVLCHKPTEGLDWWHLNGVSGPCCCYTRGCRQQAGSHVFSSPSLPCRAGGEG